MILKMTLNHFLDLAEMPVRGLQSDLYPSDARSAVDEADCTGLTALSDPNRYRGDGMSVTSLEGLAAHRVEGPHARGLRPWRVPKIFNS